MHPKKGEPIFVQTAPSLEGVKREWNTVSRWVTEMGIEPKDSDGGLMVIHEDGKPILSIPYLPLKKAWKPYT